ncbi:hypothetical protein CNR37_00052 [Pseudomonas phage ventosus]|uniref:Uncharacterized protein n=1 Tax=Pseudomonas phage ventosus TaxID=2048980 RepID=A0A2H4P7W5_9CAUD|nr:hypothetical protein CNR37_00052 [Pseudomonas phage ventosus]
MLKRTALIALAAAVIGYAALPQHAEAAGYKSSRSSSFSSSRSVSRSSSNYSRPKAIAPSRSTPYSRPSSAPRSASSTPYSRPTSRPVTTPRNSSYKPSTPYGNASRYRAPTRQVSSPMSRPSRPSYAPRNYSSNRGFGGYKGSSGYNRGHYGGYGGGYNRGYGGGYGGGMMGGNGPGLGSMLLAGAGGAIIGNMLYNNFSHTPSGAANTTRTDTVLPASEVAQIQQEQRIEDKLDQVNDKLDAFPAGPQGYLLPPDAPLMMSPDFYKLGGQM